MSFWCFVRKSRQSVELSGMDLGEDDGNLGAFALLVTLKDMFLVMIYHTKDAPYFKVQQSQQLWMIHQLSGTSQFEILIRKILFLPFWLSLTLSSHWPMTPGQMCTLGWGEVLQLSTCFFSAEVLSDFVTCPRSLCSQGTSLVACIWPWDSWELLKCSSNTTQASSSTYSRFNKRYTAGHRTLHWVFHLTDIQDVAPLNDEAHHMALSHSLSLSLIYLTRSLWG